MSLALGARLGHYEVVSLLGVGGMGEVYKARDTRLPRSVAIKVLLARFRDDEARHERFLREAQAVASLSHPHICALHDVGEHQGVDFLVFECLEGHTLAALLAGGRLPLAQVLRYGSQIADALAHAHRHGIVHRDLKPQNIMITSSGARLMDFGLARLHAAPAAGQTHLSTTFLPTLTAEGAVIGTVAYMSPEQLEGREADARSDIFSLGVTLYEMAAGRRPFANSSEAGLIGAILRDDPPPLDAAAPGVPRSLSLLVNGCLAKDAEGRFHSAHDVRMLLDGMASETAVGAPAAVHRSSRAPVILGTAAAAMLAVAAGAVVARRGSTAPVTAPAASFVIDAPVGEERLDQLAVSPDGRRVVFVGRTAGGRQRLWLRSIDEVDSRRLEGTDGSTYPFWSPDGHSLAFFADSRLKRIDVDDGGPPVVICPADSGRGGTWNRDGTILFANNLTPIYRVSAAGGTPQPVTTLDVGGSDPERYSHRGPRFLPDGDHFLYLALSTTLVGELRVDSLSRPGPTVILKGATIGQYGGGSLYFSGDGVLLAQPFDPDRLTLTGEPRAVTPDLAGINGGLYDFSVSPSGTLAYRTRHTAVARTTQLTWLARDGRELGQVGEPGGVRDPALSPDGRRVAMVRDGDLWALELPGGTPIPLTSDAPEDARPVWSPDSTRVAFMRRAGALAQLYSLPGDGSGEAALLLPTSPQGKTPIGWTRGMDAFIYLILGRSGGIWRQAPGSNPIAFRDDRAALADAALSPDGRWIAYASSRSGQREVYVEPFLAPGTPRQVSEGGGRQIRWGRDGRELFFLAGANQLTVVSLDLAAGEPRITRTTLFPLRVPAEPDLGAQYDVARDGRILAAVIRSAETVVTRLIVSIGGAGR